MNAGDGAQCFPGGEVERVTMQQTQEIFCNSEFHDSGPIIRRLLNQKTRTVALS